MVSELLELLACDLAICNATLLDVWPRSCNDPQARLFCSIEKWLQGIYPFQVDFAAFWVDHGPVSVNTDGIQSTRLGFLHDILP